MKHLSREDVLVARLLRRAKIIAVIGASPRPERHSHSVVKQLRAAGYDVIPIRSDGQDVDGLKSFARVEDVPGPIDIAVVFRRPDAAAAHVEEAARKEVDAVWLPPGVWSPAIDAAKWGSMIVVKDRCVAEDHRTMLEVTRRSARLGPPLRRRSEAIEDDRVRPEDRGYTPDGGGGAIGGGGARTRLDEKKMIGGKPSPRSGPFKRVAR